MKTLATWVAVLTLFCSPAWSADPHVILVQGQDSVKVLIGDDVFTVYNYGTERRKPFFTPVTGPGGFELLKQNVEKGEPGSLGRKVYVASESAKITGTAGDTTAAKQGEILDVSKFEDNQIWIEGRNGWIARTDIAPMAAVITRVINDDPAPSKERFSSDKYDHPHHKGIWFAVDEINDIKFWMEGSLVRTQSVKLENSGTTAASLHIVNHWLNPENHPVLVETTTVTITSNRLLSYDSVLTPGRDEVEIGDTKEGMFAIRLAGSMKEDSGKGPVTNSDGLKSTAAAWGKTARWVNYDGPIDGHTFGVTIMDSQKNPWQSRYHVRGYGLFAVNPFGAASYTEGSDARQPKHEKTLHKGESLHFKYGLWVHGPEVTTDQIEAEYARLD